MTEILLTRALGLNSIKQTQHHALMVLSNTCYFLIYYDMQETGPLHTFFTAARWRIMMFTGLTPVGFHL